MLRFLEAAGIQRQVVELASGEKMHFLAVEGSKPTWVLLPALGNAASSWGSILRQTKGRVDAIALDLLGFGFSSGPKDAPNFRDQIEATIQFLEKAATPPFVFIGNSAGAIIAAEITRQKPEWVSALIIVGFGLIQDTDGWWKKLVEYSNSLEDYLNAAYYRPPVLTGALRTLLNETLTSPAYLSFLEDGGLNAIKTLFDGIRTPTLFVSGEDDQIIPKSSVTAAVERVPGATLEWLSRCGHHPTAEQPHKLYSVIQEFLGKQK